VNASPAPWRFEAFEVSYFSAKVRPALRYKQLWYEEVRADLRDIVKRTGLAFIPILVTPEGDVWQDSTDIFERLEARHPRPPLFPSTPLQLLASHLVELYNDEFGTIPAMHYRWGSERGHASARSRFIAMTGSREIGNRAADQMAGARIALGATDETGPAIEAHTRALLAALCAHFEAHPYLFGDRMTFGDCALMGLIDGHLFTDLVSRELLLETARPVVGWIERCKFPDSEKQGAWLADDEIDPTCVEVLGAMGRDAAPVILDSVTRFEQWADGRVPDVTAPPRAVGPVETRLRGVPMTRIVQSYTLWMLQRTLDAYGALDEASRKRVDEALAGTGWEPVLAYEPRHRLAKDGYELVFVPTGRV
jgi:glutathione S-transferase